MNTHWQGIKAGSKTSFMQLYDELYKVLFHYGMTINRDVVIDASTFCFVSYGKDVIDFPIP